MRVINDGWVEKGFFSLFCGLDRYHLHVSFAWLRGFLQIGDVETED
jgi:hypothetical protein